MREVAIELGETLLTQTLTDQEKLDLIDLAQQAVKESRTIFNPKPE